MIDNWLDQRAESRDTGNQFAVRMDTGGWNRDAADESKEEDNEDASPHSSLADRDLRPFHGPSLLCGRRLGLVCG